MRKETRYPQCFAPDLVSTVDPVRNRRNDRYVDFGDNVEDHVRYISSTKQAAVVMLLGLMSSNGEVSPPPPVLFDGSCRLNADRYIDVTTSIIIPWIRKAAGKKKFVFQQDGVPTHTANKTQAFLKKIDLWAKSMWPPRVRTLTPWTTVCRDEWRVARVRLGRRTSNS